MSPKQVTRGTPNFLHQLMDNVVGVAEWESILYKALSQALEGDARAREWLADRRFGKAKETVEVMGDQSAITLTDTQLLEIITSRQALPLDQVGTVQAEVRVLPAPDYSVIRKEENTT